MNEKLVLTPDEVDMIAHHAVSRRCRNMWGNHGDRTLVESGSPWDCEIEGAAAEYWYCKLTDQLWTGVSAIRASDAGLDEIRWTGRKNGNLLLHESDSPSQRYILIGGAAPRFFIVGWALGSEAKKQCYWEEEWQWFKYPRRLLRSAEELFQKPKGETLYLWADLR